MTSSGFRSAAFALLGMLLALPAQAVPMLYTYDWTATNIQDSNGNAPPVNPTSSSGFFSIELDTAAIPGLVLNVPVSAASVFSTDSGATITAAATGYTVASQLSTTRRISVGGLINGAASLVGLTDDYRIEFIVDWTGGLPTPTGDLVQTPFIYTNSPNGGSPNGGAFTGDLQIALRNTLGVPAPASLPLVLLGLCAFSVRRRARR